MKTAAILASVALLLVFWVAHDAWSGPHSLTGVVTHVYDGDTLRVDPLGKVRLLGIDAPERDASERDRYYLRQGVAEATLRRVAATSRSYLKQLTFAQTVSLELDHAERDQYGRLLAYVYLPDGRMVNQLLIEQGLASVYRRFDFLNKADFLHSEKTARSRSLGLWAGMKENEM